MNLIAELALVGFPLIVPFLFVYNPPRKAVILTLIGGWLFLPMASFKVPGLPDYSKMSILGVSILICGLIFDRPRFRRFRPGWVDLPVAVWCLIPILTSVANDLGLYDGLRAATDRSVHWGLLYLIGRVYFGGATEMRDLAVGLFIGGLVYVPFCLFEIRMSPVLHHWVYGYNASDFTESVRLGGWRPAVFLPHGLAVGLWMAMATLSGFWLWTTGAIERIWGRPVWLLLLVLAVTTVLCKSLGALVLLGVGLLALLCARWAGTRLPFLLLLVVPVLYVASRSTGVWSGRQLLDVIRAGTGSEERADSVAYRLHAEDILSRHALDHPLLGWGAWGRNRPVDEGGSESTATDGLWIIALGLNGVTGLCALFGLLLLPVFLAWRRLPVHSWMDPRVAPGVVLMTVIVLFVIDSLMNAMHNPMVVVACGALTRGLLQSAESRPAAAPRGGVATVPALSGGARL